jgi:adenosine deaminase CECR1
MMARVKEIARNSKLPDDEWEEVAEGIPSRDEPFLQQYVGGREKLIAQEKSQRSGKYSLPNPTMRTKQRFRSFIP